MVAECRVCHDSTADVTPLFEKEHRMSRSIFGRFSRGLVALLCGLIALAIPVTANANVSELAPKHVMRTLPAAASDQAVRGEARPGGPKTTSNGINYHGGPVMT